MKFILFILLVLGIPFSLFAAEYSILSDTSRIGYYNSGELSTVSSSKYGHLSELACGSNIIRTEENFNNANGWYLVGYSCMDINLYNNQKNIGEEQKKKEEEAQKLQNEIYKNTIAEQNKKKDLEAYNKSIEEAKKVLEQKTQSEAKVMTATTEIKKTLSLAGQKKASLLKKRIELLQKKITQLQKQIDEIK